MRRNSMRLLGAALAFVICLSLWPASRDTGMVWGANGHPFVSYPGVSYAQQLDFVVDLGMTQYRVDLGGADRRKPLRELVKLARQREITILPILQPPVILETMSTSEIYKISYNYARKLSSEFRRDIPVFELGNEMENFAIIQPCETMDNGEQYPCEWGPAAGSAPLHYYGPRWEKVSAALKGMSEGVAKGAPKARRAVGTAGWGHTGAFERMAADGIEWDITVWHTYSFDNDASFELLLKWGKPIWVTEFNNPRGSEVSEVQQAAGLATLMRDFKAKAETYDIEAAFVYELMDESYWAPDYESVMGLVRLEPNGQGWRAGEPKAAYAAAKQIIAGEP